MSLREETPDALEEGEEMANEYKANNPTQLPRVHVSDERLANLRRLADSAAPPNEKLREGARKHAEFCRKHPTW